MRTIASCTCLVAILLSHGADARVSRTPLPSVEIHLEVLERFAGSPQMALSTPTLSAPSYSSPNINSSTSWHLNKGAQPVADLSRQPDPVRTPPARLSTRRSAASAPIRSVTPSRPQPLAEPWNPNPAPAPVVAKLKADTPAKAPTKQADPMPELGALPMMAEPAAQAKQHDVMSPEKMAQDNSAEANSFDPLLLPDAENTAADTQLAALELPEIADSNDEDLDALFADMGGNEPAVPADNANLALPELGNDAVASGDDELDALLADIPDVSFETDDSVPQLPELDLGNDNTGDVPAMPELPIAAPAATAPSDSDMIAEDLFADLPDLSDEPADLALPSIVDEPSKQLIIRYESSETAVPIAAQSELDGLVEKMEADADMRITVVAYAGGDSSQKRAIMRTSHSRAMAIREYVIGKGIDSVRIVPKAGGIAEDGSADRADILY